MNQLIINIASMWNDPSAIGPVLLLISLILLSIALALVFRFFVRKHRIKEWERRQVSPTPVLKVCTFEPKLGYEPSEIIKLLDREVG